MISVGLSLQSLCTLLHMDYPGTDLNCNKDLEIFNGVFLASYNSSNSVTLAGSKSSIDAFISILSSSNVFYKEFDTCSIAFHSPLLTEEIIDEICTLQYPVFELQNYFSEAAAPKWLTSLKLDNLSNMLLNNLRSTCNFAVTVLKIPENVLLFLICC